MPKGGRELRENRESTGRIDKDIVDTMAAEHYEEAGGFLDPRKAEDDDVLVGNGEGFILKGSSGEKQGSFVVFMIAREEDTYGDPWDNRYHTETEEMDLREDSCRRAF